jgi:hypothetical protein
MNSLYSKVIWGNLVDRSAWNEDQPIHDITKMVNSF